jgi:RNA polymerase sigma-70 factor (ECF subfamily)
MASQQELTDERNARFLALLEPIYADCQRWALSLTGNREDAEDVLEESILLALKSVGQLKNDKAFKTWMFRIMSRSHLMLIRSRKRPVDFMDQEQLAVAVPGTPDKAPLRDRSEGLKAVLAKLAPEQRQALVLFEVHELSIREVSQVMEKNETAVRVLLHRARHRLAELLRQAGIEPQ